MSDDFGWRLRAEGQAVGDVVEPASQMAVSIYHGQLPSELALLGYGPRISYETCKDTGLKVAVVRS